MENRSLEVMNRLNRAIKDKLSYHEGKPILAHEAIVSSTELEVKTNKALPNYLKAMGIDVSTLDDESSVFVLRSCIMTPYLTSDYTDEDYIERFMAALLHACNAAVAELA